MATALRGLLRAAAPSEVSFPACSTASTGCRSGFEEALEREPAEPFVPAYHQAAE